MHLDEIGHFVPKIFIQSLRSLDSQPYRWDCILYRVIVSLVTKHHSWWFPLPRLSAGSAREDKLSFQTLCRSSVKQDGGLMDILHIHIYILYFQVGVLHLHPRLWLDLLVGQGLAVEHQVLLVQLSLSSGMLMQKSLTTLHLSIQLTQAQHPLFLDGQWCLVVLHAGTVLLLVLVYQPVLCVSPSLIWRYSL